MRCRCQAASGCRKATPRLWGWGSKAATGGGPAKCRAQPRVLLAAVGPPACTLPKVPPKQALPSRPRPAPTPGCRHCQGRWLEERGHSPAGSGPSGEGGAPTGAVPALSPFPTAAWPTLPFPYTVTAAGGLCLGDAHLFWKAISSRGSRMFSSGSHVLYLAREKGGGHGVKKNRASFAASR